MLLSRLKHPTERLAYAQSAVLHGWSRNMLNIHIETRLLERTGSSETSELTESPKNVYFRIYLNS
jgi:predicted nuclease of restriction endonuclease-like (RecB) superfamily